MKVIVSTSLHSKVLKELHDGNPGMNTMKQIASSHVWWPNINKDIEKVNKNVDPSGSFAIHYPRSHYTTGCGLG